MDINIPLTFWLNQFYTTFKERRLNIWIEKEVCKIIKENNFLNRMIQVSFPDWDRELFMYLNSKSVPWLDPIMILLSTYTAWFALSILVILFMIWKNRMEGIKGVLFLTGGV